MFDLKRGTMIAIAAGTLFATSCKKSEPDPSPPASERTKQAQPGSAEKTAKVHCTGINDCSGKSECKTAANDCAGNNACKGQGFLDMSDDECKAKGGTVMANAGM